MQIRVEIRVDCSRCVYHILALARRFLSLNSCILLLSFSPICLRNPSQQVPHLLCFVYLPFRPNPPEQQRMNEKGQTELPGQKDQATELA